MKKFLLFFALLLPTVIWAQQINVTPKALSDFSYIENEGPSEESTFVVSATDLIDTIGITDTLLITASAHFEISTQTGENFVTILRLFADTTGTVDTTTIYVRMVKNLTAQSYEENIVISSIKGWAPSDTVHCSGIVVQPTLPAPRFEPEGDTYTGAQEVYITCEIEGATIQYRHNPNEEWIDYTSPIFVDRNMTIWAKAIKNGYIESPETSAEYSIIYNITVTSDIVCGSVSGGGEYNYGDTAILTATPNESYLFSSWSNGDSSNPLKITVTENATFIAIFVPLRYEVTIAANPENGGGVSGGGTYHWGQNCTVVAFANTNYAFDNWTEDGEIVSTDAEYTFRCYRDHSLVAHFHLTALPTISDEIAEPDAICAGNPLELSAPEVNFSNNGEWQISADTSFELYSMYEGQSLDTTYNGWQLRYAASNDAGISYSNMVTITVYPVIEDDEILDIIGKKCGDKVEHILVYPKSGYQYQWYYDNNPIDTTQYIHSTNGLKNGTYRVEIALAKGNDGQLLCPVTSDEYEVGFTNRMVYPNPAHVNAEIFVTNGNDSDAVFSIYSIDGKLVHQQMVNSGKNTIQACLSKGVYISTLVNENDTTTEKIVIQ